MPIKNKNLLLCLLLVSIFSLNTVFGIDLDEAHPKKTLEKTPAASQPYDYLNLIQNGKLAHPTAFYASQYIQFIFDNFTAIFLSYQAQVIVALKTQQHLIFTVPALLSKHFISFKTQQFHPKRPASVDHFSLAQ